MIHEDTRPVFLFHGTNPENLESILTHGLIPNRHTKYRGWEVPYGGIYLTRSLPYAIEMGGERSRPVLIFEVEVQDPSNLLWDEDELPLATPYLYRNGNATEEFTFELLELAGKLDENEQPQDKALLASVYDIADRVINELLPFYLAGATKGQLRNIERRDQTIRQLKNQLSLLLPVDASIRSVKHFRTLKSIKFNGDPRLVSAFLIDRGSNTIEKIFETPEP